MANKSSAVSVLERIRELYKKNAEYGKKAAQVFASLRNDASSQYYAPYASGKSNYTELTDFFGVDKFDDAFFAANDGLRSYYKLNANGTPQAPTKSSSAEEKAAYEYYKAVKADEYTKKLEDQWRAIQKYIYDGVNAGYDDATILKGIETDASAKYADLFDYDEKVQARQTPSTTRPVAYTKDYLQAVMYNARRGKRVGMTDYDYLPDLVDYYASQNKPMLPVKSKTTTPPAAVKTTTPTTTTTGTTPAPVTTPNPQSAQAPVVITPKPIVTPAPTPAPGPNPNPNYVPDQQEQAQNVPVQDTSAQNNSAYISPDAMKNGVKDAASAVMEKNYQDYQARVQAGETLTGEDLAYYNELQKVYGGTQETPVEQSTTEPAQPSSNVEPNRPGTGSSSSVVIPSVVRRKNNTSSIKVYYWDTESGQKVAKNISMSGQPATSQDVNDFLALYNIKHWGGDLDENEQAKYDQLEKKFGKKLLDSLGLSSFVNLYPGDGSDESKEYADLQYDANSGYPDSRYSQRYQELQKKYGGETSNKLKPAGILASAGTSDVGMSNTSSLADQNKAWLDKYTSLVESEYVQKNSREALPSAEELKRAASMADRLGISVEEYWKNIYNGTPEWLPELDRLSDRMNNPDLTTRVRDVKEVLADYLSGADISDAEQAMMKEYDKSHKYLLGGYAYSAGSPQVSVADGRKSLGQTAYNALKAADSPLMDKQENAALIYEIGNDMDAAFGKYIDLEQYYAANPERKAMMESFVAEQQRREIIQKQEQEKEAQQAAYMQHQSAMAALDAYAKGETLTEDQKAVVQYAQNAPITDADISDPAYVKMEDALFESTDGKDYGIDQWMTDTEFMTYKYAALDEVLAVDVRMAKYAGMTLSEYYAKYPQLQKTPSELVQAGKQLTEQKWGANNGFDLYGFLFGTSASDLTGSGIGTGEAIGKGAEVGVNRFGEGFVGFWHNYVTWKDEDTVKQWNRANYGTDRRSAGIDFDTAISNLKDPAEKQYWTALKAATKDVLDLPFNFADSETLNSLYSVKSNIKEIEEYVFKNATPEEYAAFQISSSVVDNALSMATTAAVTAGTGYPYLGTTVGFGLPVAYQGSEAAQAAGFDHSTSNAIGLATAGISVWTEGLAFEKLTNPAFWEGAIRSVQQQVTKEGASLLKRFTSTVTQGAIHLGEKLAGAALVEAPQEFTENVLQDAFLNIVGAQSKGVGQILSDGAQAGAMALITSPLLSGQAKFYSMFRSKNAVQLEAGTEINLYTGEVSVPSAQAKSPEKIYKNGPETPNVALDSPMFDRTVSLESQTVAPNAEENTVSQKEKFDTETTVEQSGGLIAVHNIDAKNLVSMFDLGGFPAPSIAIFNAMKGNHERFGDVSVVFSQNTVDPSSNPDNHLFTGDAWTPSVPKSFMDENGDLKPGVTANDIVSAMKESILMDAKSAGSEVSEVSSLEELYSYADSVLSKSELTASGELNKAYASADRQYKKAKLIYNIFKAQTILDALKKPFSKTGIVSTAKEVGSNLDAIAQTYESKGEEAARQQAQELGIGGKAFEKWFASEKSLDTVTNSAHDLTVSQTYLEAKPMRVVGVDEIVSVLVPKGNTKLIGYLKNSGVDVVAYDPDAEGDRARILNSSKFDSARFQQNKAVSITPEMQEAAKGFMNKLAADMIQSGSDAISSVASALSANEVVKAITKADFSQFDVQSLRDAHAAKQEAEADMTKANNELSAQQKKYVAAIRENVSAGQIIDPEQNRAMLEGISKAKAVSDGAIKTYKAVNEKFAKAKDALNQQFGNFIKTARAEAQKKAEHAVNPSETINTDANSPQTASQNGATEINASFVSSLTPDSVSGLSYNGIKIKYNPSLEGEGRNHTTYIELGNKFFSLDSAGERMQVLKHEAAHNVTDQLITSDNWDALVGAFLRKKVAEKGSVREGETYFEGLYGAIGSDALSETITDSVVSYLSDPESLKKRSAAAFSIIDGYFKGKQGETLPIAPQTAPEAPTVLPNQESGINVPPEEEELYGPENGLKTQGSDLVQQTDVSIPPPGSNQSDNVPDAGTGKRQFANETAQNTDFLPGYIKETLLNTPEYSDYTIQHNTEQITEGYRVLRSNGYDQTVESLLSKDRFSSIDTATALVVMAEAKSKNDFDTLTAVAIKYNELGTSAGQELQARSIYLKMTPVGAMATAAADTQIAFDAEWSKKNKGFKDDIAANIKKTKAEVLALPASETDGGSNKWHVELNEQQWALIDKYGLAGVNRPGIHYNRATLKQRMLEAILATPNVGAESNNGLSLIDRLEYMKAGLPVVTNADLDYIGSRMAEFMGAGQDAGGRDAQVALSRANEAAANIKPVSMRQKTKSWRMMSMLGNFVTPTRNVIGNVAQNFLNDVSKIIASGIDKGISVVSKQRTVSAPSVQDRIDGTTAFIDAAKDTFKDFFVDKVDTGGENKYEVRGRRVYQSPVLEAAKNATAFALSFGDRPFFKRAYVQSLAEQMRVNNTGITTETMIDQAISDAKYATFTEDNRVADALKRIKNGRFGWIVDFIIPFDLVPTNITKRMVEYSPLNLANAVVHDAIYDGFVNRKFDQKRFVTNMARGLTGTGLWAVGLALGAAGHIKLGTGGEDDKDKANVMASTGDQYSPFVELFGKKVGLSFLVPGVSPLIMGAATYDAIKDNQDAFTALWSGVSTMGDQIFDASFLTSLQDVFSGGESISQNFVNTVPGNALSQFVPSILRQVANGLDPYVRDTNEKDVVMRAIKKGIWTNIPFLRESLPAKIDIAGNPVESKGLVNSLFNPAYLTNDTKDPALDELIRLSNVDGSVLPSDNLYGANNSISDKLRALTDAEKEEYKRRKGSLMMDGGTTLNKAGAQYTMPGIRAVMESEAYQSMTDEEKVEAIKAQISASKIGVDAEFTKRISEAPTLTMYDADKNKSYMKTIQSLYDRTGDSYFVPGEPSYNWSDGGVKLTIPDEIKPYIEASYRLALESGINAVTNWDTMTDEQAKSKMESIRSKAATAAKNRALEELKKLGK